MMFSKMGGLDWYGRRMMMIAGEKEKIREGRWWCRHWINQSMRGSVLAHQPTPNIYTKIQTQIQIQIHIEMQRISISPQRTHIHQNTGFSKLNCSGYVMGLQIVAKIQGCDFAKIQGCDFAEQIFYDQMDENIKLETRHREDFCSPLRQHSAPIRILFTSKCGTLHQFGEYYTTTNIPPLS